MNGIKQEVIAFLAEQPNLRFDAFGWSEDQSIEDLGMTSLDLMNLLYSLEDRFGFTLETVEILEVATVGDLISLVETKMREKDMA
jgi:acyl carrier protein